MGIARFLAGLAGKSGVAAGGAGRMSGDPQMPQKRLEVSIMLPHEPR